MDKRREGGRLLAAAGIVEEEAGIGLAPGCENAEEAGVLQVRRGKVFPEEGEAEAIQGGANDQGDVVQEGAAECGGEGVAKF